MSIKKLQLEIRKLGILEEGLNDVLEEQGKQITAEISEKTSASLVEEYGQKGKKGVGEVKNGLEIATKDILEFIDKGGVISVYTYNRTVETVEQKLLKDKTRNIMKLREIVGNQPLLEENVRSATVNKTTKKAKRKTTKSKAKPDESSKKPT